MSFAERYPSAARRELRSLLALPMLGCLFSGLLLAAYGASHASTPSGWAAFSGSGICLTSTAGLYRLREWARWGAFVVALLAVTLTVVSLFRDGLPLPWSVLVGRLAAGGYYVGLAVYLPSSAAARALELARSRWVPRTRREARASEDRTSPC